jgi:hypothetical protein
MNRFEHPDSLPPSRCRLLILIDARLNHLAVLASNPIGTKLQPEMKH